MARKAVELKYVFGDDLPNFAFPARVSYKHYSLKGELKPEISRLHI